MRRYYGVTYSGRRLVFLRSHATFRAAGSVLLLLVLAFVFTGLLSSFYRRERESLGEVHYRRGQRLAAANALTDAAEEYRQALLFSPDKTEYRIALATVLIDAGRLDEARSHLEQLVEDDPTNPRLNLMLARVALDRHRPEDAIAYYQRAVYEYWPGSKTADRRAARWELIKLLGQSGRRNEAVGELMQLYANAPPDPQMKGKIGFLLLTYGATSEASQVFHDLTRQFPQDEEAHRGLGNVYFSSGDYVSARHEFQRATRMDPKDRDSADALTLTNTVIDIDPALPGITSAERMRRSQNLLRRVVADFQQCPPNDALTARLTDAQTVLTAKHAADADLSLQLQNTAQQLWKDRSSLCGQSTRPDPAVEAALARIQ